MNVPNFLSIVRIILIPVFAVVYLSAPEVAPEAGLWVPQYLLAAGILLFSGLTDVLDGVIARRCHQITKLGRILDPVADKLTQATVTVLMAVRNPEWTILPILYIGKEVLMLIGGVKLLKMHHDIAPSKWFGKLATAVFYITMILLIAMPGLPSWATITAITLVIVTTVFAFGMYFPLYFKYLQNKNEMQQKK